MLKLIKYELRKTWFTKAILLAVTAVVEIAFLVGLYMHQDDTLATSVALLVFLAVGGVLMPTVVGMLADRHGFGGGMAAILAAIVLLAALSAVNAAMREKR